MHSMTFITKSKFVGLAIQMVFDMTPAHIFSINITLNTLRIKTNTFLLPEFTIFLLVSGDI